MKKKIKYKDGYRITEYWFYVFPLGWQKYEIKESVWHNPNWQFNDKNIINS